MNTSADEALQAALNRQAQEHDAAAQQCRTERRAVWLRLHEAGFTYAALEDLTGYGSTTLYQELKRARQDRQGS